MKLDGSGLRRLTSGKRDTYPVFSRDGKRIAFVRALRGQWRLHVMSPSGAKPRLLRQAPPAGRPTWAPEALRDAGVEYELAPEPCPGERPKMVEHTGQKRFPAIEFEDGSWYREDSKKMAAAIRAGRLNKMRGTTPAARTA